MISRSVLVTDLNVGPVGGGVLSPELPLDHLVHEAADHTGLRQAVQHEEDGDPGHQPPGLLAGGHQAGHQPGQEGEEGGAQQDAGGYDEHVEESLLGLLAHSTQPRQLVPVYLISDQRRESEGCRQPPAQAVVQGRLAGQLGGREGAEQEQRPGGGGDGPPHGGGQAGEVEEDEDDSAERGRGETLPDQQAGPAPWHPHTADPALPRHQPQQVGEAHQEVGEIEEHDAPLGVLQQGRVQQERQQGEGGAQEAETGPDSHPDQDELLVLLLEEDVQPALGNTLPRPVDVVMVPGESHAGAFT